MPLAIVLSSFVSASRVGGGGQQHAFASWRIDPCLIPTVVFGRHPGKGAPGGEALAPPVFRALLAAVEAEGLFGKADAVLPGYFAHPDQVSAAAETIDRVRAAPREGAFSPAPVVVVDPILGDEGAGLYVAETVAEAVARELVPRADWITPNLWELRRLSGRPVSDAASALEAARALGRPALVTSVPAGPGRVGLLLAQEDRAVLFAHDLWPDVPHGTGDLVAAVFAAELVHGAAPETAAEIAARTAAWTAKAAFHWKAGELPLVALGDRLSRPDARVPIERIDLAGPRS